MNMKKPTTVSWLNWTVKCRKPATSSAWGMNTGGFWSIKLAEWRVSGDLCFLKISLSLQVAH